MNTTTHEETKRLEVGVHRIPMAEYLADPCPEPSLSSSMLNRLVTRSPMHAYHEHPRLGNGSRFDSNKADMGTVAHDILLGGEGKICIIDPEDFAGAKGAFPKGWTNNAIREARDEARANGLTPILKGAELAAKAMAAKARKFLADSEIAGVLDDGEAELTIVAQVNGVYLRARPDWFNPVKKIMLHYKTTEASAEPCRFIAGVMRGMGYGTAVAFYQKVWESFSAENFDWTHVILVQEQDAPYACSLIALDPVTLSIEMQAVDYGIMTWAQCLKSGKWPGYPGLIHYAAASSWELAAAEQRL